MALKEGEFCGERYPVTVEGLRKMFPSKPFVMEKIYGSPIIQEINKLQDELDEIERFRRHLLR